MEFKYVVAIVGPEFVASLEVKLSRIGIGGITLSRVKGFGEYKNYFSGDGARPQDFSATDQPQRNQDMHCNFKTVIKLAVGLGAILAVGYFALPGGQAFILASAPLLLALVCPVAMLIMMFSMRGNAGGRKEEGAEPAVTDALDQARDVVSDKA